MKKFKILTAMILVAFAFISTSDAEARIGGGRTSGFRGSRGFSTNQRYQTPPTNNYSNNYQSGQNTMGQPSVGSSPMMRGLLGGLAGGFIGSMLFKSFSHADDGQTTGDGGIGFLEILLMAVAGFFIFRWFAQRKMAANAAAYEQTRAPAFASEQDRAQVLQGYDRSFDLSTFKEQRMDDFLKIQSAWNARDLSPVSNIIASDFQQTLDADIENLKKNQRINRLENIAIRNASLVESWQETGKEYATLKFQAQLLDFTIDENTQAVVAGDRHQPVKFEEEWTFVRDAGASPWVLAAISQI